MKVKIIFSKYAVYECGQWVLKMCIFSVQDLPDTIHIGGRILPSNCVGICGFDKDIRGKGKANLIIIILICEHKTSLKSMGDICSNSQKYIVWVKIIDFSFMPKIIRILRSCSMNIFCKCPTVNISKLNF